ncbi:transcriptional repressor LexA [Acidihalobacter ferrooxydans]|uniref:Repressor LexA n=1 Tax=Acidihalobacter ferrooxydans TaxID=1765967 RepID=A0A1P8UHE9_9GAMM|nr:transcriptional repressor LexA [Acidihalobacter ferrooxydans]APZ43204.1 repressor LexA [Acidihalobacter ferrooxydans]
MHPRQAEILNAIRNHFTTYGHAPTLTEIGQRLGLEKNTVHYHVRAMLSAGLLIREPGWRGLRLPANMDEEAMRSLPLAGRIAAGHPIEAIPGQDALDLSALLLGSGRYALQVKGESMIDAGIFDGDYVILERRDHAQDGDIVAALIDNEDATLKRLRHTNAGEVLLVPENADMAPMVFAPERVSIQGVLVAQLRRYR